MTTFGREGGVGEDLQWYRRHTIGGQHCCHLKGVFIPIFLFFDPNQWMTPCWLAFIKSIRLNGSMRFQCTISQVNPVLNSGCGF